MVLICVAKCITMGAASHGDCLREFLPREVIPRLLGMLETPGSALHQGYTLQSLLHLATQGAFFLHLSFLCWAATTVVLGQLLKWLGVYICRISPVSLGGSRDKGVCGASRGTRAA
jgi:hypothetical protein